MRFSISDADGFVQAYEFYRNKIYNYFFFRLLNKEMSDDLASDTFVKAFIKRNSYNADESELSTWLFTIAKNLLVDHFRREKYSSLADISNCIEIMDARPTPEEMCESEFERECVVRTLYSLRETDRAIIYLRYYMDFSYRDIAQHMNITESNVKVTLHRAMKKFKISYIKEEHKFEHKHIQEKLNRTNVLS